MSASWSRPTSSPKNTRAIMSVDLKTTGRRTVGQARAHGLDGTQGATRGGLSRLDAGDDADTSPRDRVAAAVGRVLSALLPSPLLPHPRPRRSPDRPAGRRPPGAVRVQPHRIPRYHRSRLP